MVLSAFMIILIGKWNYSQQILALLHPQASLLTFNDGMQSSPPIVWNLDEKGREAKVTLEMG